MIAECANEMEGVTTEAIDAVNQVRTRAGASPVKTSDFTQESFRQFIRDERTRELCYEVPRRMELRRHGPEYFKSQLEILSSQLLNANNKQIGTTWKVSKRYRLRTLQRNTSTSPSHR